MRGDEKHRFCEHCQLRVHNLSAMTLAEQQALLSQKPGTRQCIAYVAPDNAIQVRTGTWLLLQRVLRPWRAGLALLAILFSIITTGCSTTRRSSPPSHMEAQTCTQRPSTYDDKNMTMGEPVAASPLWRRILFFWPW
jgi:hypothetical protein